MLGEPATDTAFIHRTDLVGLLSPSLGEEKASQLVIKAATTLGLPTFRFNREQAASLLEIISKQPGLIGITARLAGVRLPRLFR